MNLVHLPTQASNAVGTRSTATRIGRPFPNKHDACGLKRTILRPAGKTPSVLPTRPQHESDGDETMMGIRSLDCVRINWVPRPRKLGIGHGGLNATGFALALLALLIGSSAFGQQLDPVTKWATDTSYQSTIHQNIIYQKAGSQNLRLD